MIPNDIITITATIPIIFLEGSILLLSFTAGSISFNLVSISPRICWISEIPLPPINTTFKVY
jgi:hypothetical protein